MFKKIFLLNNFEKTMEKIQIFNIFYCYKYYNFLGFPLN